MDSLAPSCLSQGSGKRLMVSRTLSNVSMSKLLWKVTPPYQVACLLQKLHFILKAGPNKLRKGKRKDGGRGRAETWWEVGGVRLL